MVLALHALPPSDRRFVLKVPGVCVLAVEVLSLSRHGRAFLAHDVRELMCVCVRMGTGEVGGQTGWEHGRRAQLVAPAQHPGRQ